ncbi:MAG: hypothetical protein ABSB57_01830, partial [Dehalococcoidia bacterium]
MGLPTKPLKAIFPLVVANLKPGLVGPFLGTGFFIRPDGTFLTAKHVLEGVTPASGEDLAVEFLCKRDRKRRLTRRRGTDNEKNGGFRHIDSGWEMPRSSR